MINILGNIINPDGGKRSYFAFVTGCEAENYYDGL